MGPDPDRASPLLPASSWWGHTASRSRHLEGCLKMAIRARGSLGKQFPAAFQLPALPLLWLQPPPSNTKAHRHHAGAPPKAICTSCVLTCTLPPQLRDPPPPRTLSFQPIGLPAAAPHSNYPGLKSTQFNSVARVTPPGRLELHPRARPSGWCGGRR